jgi:hypothetical protein
MSFKKLCAKINASVFLWMQDQLNAFIGASGAPPPTVVTVVIGSMLIVNALVYVLLMHVLYLVLLSSMGFTISRPPGFLERLIFRRAGV